MTQTTSEEVSDLKKALAEMSKVLTTVSAELAKRPAVTALEQLVGLPANPLAFPVGADGKYPVLFTSILHPHLLPDVITQISKFEFPPTHLGRLLKTATVAPQMPMNLLIGLNGAATFIPAVPVPGATALIREVPDILTFTDAWMIFMSVLQNQQLALPIAQALSAHLSNIITVARAYPWASVLDYHVAFMQARALDPFFNPITWTRSDPHLHTMHLLTPSLSSPLPSSIAVSPDRTAKPTQTCFAYNGAGCSGPSVGCFRRHICRACGGPHPAPLCRAVEPPEAPAAGN
ncbi:hypothetical protein C8J57DRAFT_260489 [Mycena rebaudengoi]|nr:hypothetical protein C8J57DRAFT_260489 [Mycena rebaudengoi]